MKIYLDACALNRLTDDQSQPRIRNEAEAVEAILRRVETGEVRWIGGVVVEAEVLRNPNVQKREDALALLAFANERPSLSPGVIKRATSLEGVGYGSFDALHLALAEAAQADFLLTTDDRFIRQAERGLGKPAVAVQNPLNWLQESGV
ncbi:MAG TPA: PIN domain-containing protein [Acidobacteriaceae bacterium]|nr:PIN domain-containing protein [Acidobacteriaceae bacterium]